MNRGTLPEIREEGRQLKEEHEDYVEALKSSASMSESIGYLQALRGIERALRHCEQIERQVHELEEDFNSEPYIKEE